MRHAIPFEATLSSSFDIRAMVRTAVTELVVDEKVVLIALPLSPKQYDTFLYVPYQDSGKKSFISMLLFCYSRYVVLTS